MEPQKTESEEKLTTEKLSEELGIPIEKVQKFLGEKFLAARERCTRTRVTNADGVTKTITCNQSTCLGVCHVYRLYVLEGEMAKEDMGKSPVVYHQAANEVWTCLCNS